MWPNGKLLSKSKWVVEFISGFFLAAYKLFQVIWRWCGDPWRLLQFLSLLSHFNMQDSLEPFCSIHMVADLEVSKYNFRKPTNVDQANYWGLLLIPTSFNKEPLSGYVEQVPTLDVDWAKQLELLPVLTSLIKETLAGFVEQVSTLNIPVFQSYNARYFGKLQWSRVLWTTMLVPTPIYRIHNNQLNNRKPSQMAQRIECAVAPYFQAEKICKSVRILEEKTGEIGKLPEAHQNPTQWRKASCCGPWAQTNPSDNYHTKIMWLTWIIHTFSFVWRFNQDLWKLEIGKWELHPSHDTTTCG